MVNCWFGARWFGFLESPYERDCYLGVALESQTTNPDQQLTISWWYQKRFQFLAISVWFCLPSHKNQKSQKKQNGVCIYIYNYIHLMIFRNQLNMFFQLVPSTKKELETSLKVNQKSSIPAYNVSIWFRIPECFPALVVWETQISKTMFCWYGLNHG